MGKRQRSLEELLDLRQWLLEKAPRNDELYWRDLYAAGNNEAERQAVRRNYGVISFNKALKMLDEKIAELKASKVSSQLLVSAGDSSNPGGLLVDDPDKPYGGDVVPGAVPGNKPSQEESHTRRRLSPWKIGIASAALLAGVAALVPAVREGVYSFYKQNIMVPDGGIEHSFPDLERRLSDFSGKRESYLLKKNAYMNDELYEYASSMVFSGLSPSQISLLRSEPKKVMVRLFKRESIDGKICNGLELNVTSEEGISNSRPLSNYLVYLFNCEGDEGKFPNRVKILAGSEFGNPPEYPEPMRYDSSSGGGVKYSTETLLGRLLNKLNPK